MGSIGKDEDRINRKVKSDTWPLSFCLLISRTLGSLRMKKAKLNNQAFRLQRLRWVEGEG